MPTVTSLSQYSFYNVGPLTTTFTAPLSCSTAAGRVMLGYTGQPWIGYLAESCSPARFGDCFPSGKSIDDIATPTTTAGPWQGAFFAYNSPGIACPSAWTTAGLAVKDDTGSLSLSGAYAPAFPYAMFSSLYSTATSKNYLGTSAPAYNPYMNVFAEGLGPGETAVACCPSSLTPAYNGGCYASLPTQSYTATTGCSRVGANLTHVEVTFTWNGTAVTGASPLYLGSISTTIETLTAPTGTAEPSRVGLTFVPMVTLVHKANELPTNTGVVSSSSSSATSVASGQKGEALHGAVIIAMTIWIILALAGSMPI